MKKETRVNEGIRTREVRLIGPDGAQLGVMPTKEALRIADEHDLDLVEVAAQGPIPVCRIMDYGKYRYQMSKKAQGPRKTMDVKEVKIRPQITDHDLELKIKNIQRFLNEGDKAKITMFFRGREVMHSDLARSIFDKIIEKLTDSKYIIEQNPKLEGNRITMVLIPKGGG